MDSEVYSDAGKCKRCEWELTDWLSIERGYDPVCYRKHQEELADEEFQKNQIMIDEVV